MSKLSQIENVLKGIDQAKFHSLCDSYLHLKGCEGLNPLGRVIGADKVRRGTPDITQPDGRFIFAEDSTQQEGLANKFEGDLNKCFDETKTGIPVGQIREIVLYHNSVLKLEEQKRLQELCFSRGVRLSVYVSFSK